MKKSLLAKYLVPALGLIPSKVFAQRNIVPNSIGELPGNPGSTFSYEFTNFIEIFLGVVGLVAVAFLIYGGFRYITSAGNDETAESAKKTIQNAIIGLVVVILSYVIVAIVANFFINNVA